MPNILAAPALAAGLLALPAASGSPALTPLQKIWPELRMFYADLHQNPELSTHEEKTSAKVAEKLRSAGYEVTDHVGGFGVVGVLKNGKGPTVLLRADMDALPVEERTGLPYASKVTTKNDAGETVSVMHACGHDVHMTSLVGAAQLLAEARKRWRGTLVLVGQPAEEGGPGATAMIADGFLTRFPRPDFAVAFHDAAFLPAGTVGATAGFAYANVDSIDITIHGRGGHGSTPQNTVDPIVIAARLVVSLQTIVSRERSPLDPVVVTVGSIHGGTKHNIIPDDVRLQLTVRTYKDATRKRVLDSIVRITKAEAAAAGAPREPSIKLSAGDDAVYNDPALTRRLMAVFTRSFGASRAVETEPWMGAEDFGVFGKAAGVPSVLFWVGATAPEKLAAVQGDTSKVPGLHSSEFAPDAEPTIKTGASALTLAALELLGRP